MVYICIIQIEPNFQEWKIYEYFKLTIWQILLIKIKTWWLLLWEKVYFGEGLPNH